MPLDFERAFREGGLWLKMPRFCPFLDVGNICNISLFYAHLKMIIFINEGFFDYSLDEWSLGELYC